MRIMKKPVAESHGRDSAVTKAVADIIDHVKECGDAALYEYAEKFDHTKLENLRVDRAEIEEAYAALDEKTLETLRFSAEQIADFAAEERKCLLPLELTGRVEGLRTGHKIVPVDRCACYVPAGLHPLPSTALMTIVTAREAGVKEIAACSPPMKNTGKIHPAVLAAMDMAGATEIYCMGGAQAVAAFVYGTETIKKVDMLVGPGNRYVAEAKRQVQGFVGIDSVAGPSEVMIIADETADPTLLAIDLLGQAEHDPNAQSVLVCTDRDIIEKTIKEVDRLLKDLPTRDVAQASWENNGAVYLADDMEEAIAFANAAAPEHLEVQTGQDEEVAEKLLHYGSLFVGKYATVSFGDFVSGPNHTLPTMGTGRFSGGLSVASFIKFPFHQFITETGCRNLAEHAMRFARIEGLPAHGETVRLRLEKMKEEC